MNTEFKDLQPDDENETRLWAYIDGFADSAERAAVEKLINENLEWRNKYRALMEMNQLIRGAELEEPSLRFTKNVMEEIARLHVAPAAKKYINTKLVWGIGLFFILMIAGFLIYGIAQIDWTAAGNSKSTLGIDIDKIDIGKMFNNTFVNVFMMLNIVLGLALLDRYLTKKRNDLIKRV